MNRASPCERLGHDGTAYKSSFVPWSTSFRPLSQHLARVMQLALSLLEQPTLDTVVRLTRSPSARFSKPTLDEDQRCAGHRRRKRRNSRNPAMNPNVHNTSDINDSTRAKRSSVVSTGAVSSMLRVGISAATSCDARALTEVSRATSLCRAPRFARVSISVLAPPSRLVSPG